MLLLIHLLFARGFISAHPGGRTTSLSKMDWGKTLSSEQPGAAELGFLSLISRPAQVQAAEQRQRSPGAQLRLGHQVGHPTGNQAPRAGRAAPAAGSRNCGEARGVRTARGSGLGGQGMRTPTGSAPDFRLRVDPKLRASGHTQKCRT